MDRDFIIKVSYNRDERGNPIATWVQLLEDVDPNEQVRYRSWYVDYVVRNGDVKGTVKNHINFLRSFGVPSENIKIEDLRKSHTEVPT